MAMQRHPPAARHSDRSGDDLSSHDLALVIEALTGERLEPKSDTTSAH
ncbi:hypothetical protein ABI214_10690 [Prescottella soli]|uniref:Uncharacterized protein n=1 Tax=Prescottella soli TaxID=1543852 RepID=A0ABW9FM89_9NOCA